MSRLLIAFGAGALVGALLQSGRGKRILGTFSKTVMNKVIIGDDALGKTIKTVVAKGVKQEKENGTQDK